MGGEGFEGFGGEGGGEDGAVLVLLDLDGFHELAEDGVGGGAGGGLLGVLDIAGEGEEVGEGVGGGCGLLLGGCDLIDFEEDVSAVEVERGVAEAGDEGGVRWQGKFHAEDVDLTGFYEWEPDMAYAPGGGEGGDVAVAGGEEGRAGEGTGGGAMAVDDGVNLLGCGHVGGGDGVVADEGDAVGVALAGGD